MLISSPYASIHSLWTSWISSKISLLEYSMVTNASFNHILRFVTPNQALCICHLLLKQISSVSLSPTIALTRSSTKIAYMPAGRPSSTQLNIFTAKGTHFLTYKLNWDKHEVLYPFMILWECPSIVKLPLKRFISNLVDAFTIVFFNPD